MRTALGLGAFKPKTGLNFRRMTSPEGLCSDQEEAYPLQ